MCNRPARGFTLIEMIIAIVIIGVGLAGVLSAFNTAVKASADPLVHKQMLAVAEEMLEEIMLKPFAPNGVAPVNALSSCGGGSPPSRAAFDDVSDYAGYYTSGVCDIDGQAVAGLAGYQVQVAVTTGATADLGNVAGGLLTGASGKVKRITVTVTHGSETLTLNGWRTWYACETGCPP